MYNYMSELEDLLVIDELDEDDKQKLRQLNKGMTRH